MILIDTMIWADHISRPDPQLSRLLRQDEVTMHPFVIGELALGNLRDRTLLAELAKLAAAPIAYETEVLDFIERHELHGSGIGYVDTHLLVSTRLGEDLRLWTRDRRLDAAARRLGVAYDFDLSS